MTLQLLSFAITCVGFVFSVITISVKPDAPKILGLSRPKFAGSLTCLLLLIALAVGFYADYCRRLHIRIVSDRVEGKIVAQQCTYEEIRMGTWPSDLDVLSDAVDLLYQSRKIDFLNVFIQDSLSGQHWVWLYYAPTSRPTLAVRTTYSAPTSIPFHQ
jgi:hypothetical protein